MFCWFSYDKLRGQVYGFLNEKIRKSMTSITNRDLLSCVSPRWTSLGVLFLRLAGVVYFSSLGTGYIFSRACDWLHVFPHCLSSLFVFFRSELGSRHVVTFHSLGTLNHRNSVTMIRGRGDNISCAFPQNEIVRPPYLLLL